MLIDYFRLRVLYYTFDSASSKRTEASAIKEREREVEEDKNLT